MKTLKDFLECDLFNNYNYVEIRDYDDDKVIIPRMTIKELWKHFHDTENYNSDEFVLYHIYCGNTFFDDLYKFYRGYLTLFVRYEPC